MVVAVVVVVVFVSACVCDCVCVGGGGHHLRGDQVTEVLAAVRAAGGRVQMATFSATMPEVRGRGRGRAWAVGGGAVGLVARACRRRRRWP